MKTAEEIAEEITDKWAFKFGALCEEGDLIACIKEAILADRNERDKRVIEVLEQLEGCDAIDCAMCQKRVDALLAELRKEKE